MWNRLKITYHPLALLFYSSIILAVDLATVFSDKSSKCKEKLIIDTDAGVDDVIAISLVLGIEKLTSRCPYEVVAITTSYGNTNEKQAETNMKKTLSVADRSDIPIYAGATRSFLQEYADDDYFGKDGLGDSNFEVEILAKVNQSIHASLAMIELSKIYENELTILILGPTTNVALAASLDRSFPNRVKHFYVMGASVLGIGNARPNVEFNFAADPEGNSILLSCINNSSKLTVFPWETALNSGYSDEWRKSALKSHDSKTIRFLDSIESKMYGRPRYNPIDAFTATAMIFGDKFVTKALITRMEAVVDGSARGSVLVDYAVQSKKPPNVKLILSIDIEVYKSIFICVFANQCAW